MRNVAIGSNALSAATGGNPIYNTAIGYNAGKNISGNGNVFIGANVGINSTESDTFKIGAGLFGIVLLEGDVSGTVKIRNVLRTNPISTLPANAANGSICTDSNNDVRLKRNDAWEKIYTVPAQEPVNTPYDTGRVWINGAPVYRINMFYRVSGQSLISRSKTIYKEDFADDMSVGEEPYADIYAETIKSSLKITDDSTVSGSTLVLGDGYSTELAEDGVNYIIPQGYNIDSQKDYYIFGYMEYVIDADIQTSQAKELFS